MTIVPGKVVNGRIEVEGVELDEGAEVEVRILGDYDHLTDEEAAELDAALAEADKGGGMPLSEFMRQVREGRLAPTRR